MSMKARVLRFEDISAKTKHLSISFEYEIDRGDEWRKWNGLNFTLPYISSKEEAKRMWGEMAKVMTELEAYIGRK